MCKFIPPKAASTFVFRAPLVSPGILVRQEILERRWAECSKFHFKSFKHKIIQFLTSFKPEISASVERGGYNWVRKWADPQTYSPPSRNNLQWHFFCLTTHCDWLHKLYFLLKRSHPNPKQTARLFFVICKVPKISNALIREIQALLDHEEKLDYLALMWVTYILDAFFDVDFLNFNERINKQSV